MSRQCYFYFCARNVQINRHLCTALEMEWGTRRSGRETGGVSEMPPLPSSVRQGCLAEDPSPWAWGSVLGWVWGVLVELRDSAWPCCYPGFAKMSRVGKAKTQIAMCLRLQALLRHCLRHVPPSTFTIKIPKGASLSLPVPSPPFPPTLLSDLSCPLPFAPSHLLQAPSSATSSITNCFLGSLFSSLFKIHGAFPGPIMLLPEPFQLLLQT